MRSAFWLLIIFNIISIKYSKSKGDLNNKLINFFIYKTIIYNKLR
jgi:hypothetical protein